MLNNIIIIFRLALYVYEYLLHVGAQKAAQTFLNEVNTYFELIVVCDEHLIKYKINTWCVTLYSKIQQNALEIYWSLMHKLFHIKMF